MDSQRQNMLGVDADRSVRVAVEPITPQRDEVDVTIIFPAYNEEQRLPTTLSHAREHFSSLTPLTYEVLVVDDGSIDCTKHTIDMLAAEWPQLRLISYPINRGKGYAVRRGVDSSRGKYVLFADADGATPICEERKLRKALDQGVDIAVGSRTFVGQGVHRRRTLVRRLSSTAFSLLSHIVLPVGVRDTQCGFKMLRCDAARRLFDACDEDRFLFDLFILRMARLWEYAVEEIPVSWTEMPGSKVRLIADSVGMFVRLWQVRRRTSLLFAKHSGTIYQRRGPSTLRLRRGETSQ